MKKVTLAALLSLAFLLGYGFSKLTHTSNTGPRVTGIGGIFFRAKTPAALKDWYSKYLGLHIEQGGCNFEWRQGADSTKKGFTLWVPFKQTTKYFPAGQQYMINYRVEGLNQLLDNMKAGGITPTDSIQKTSYGNFVHVTDPEGNMIELWEPNDVEFAKMSSNTTK